MNSHAVDFVLSGHNHDLHIDFDGRTALMESEQDANYVTIVDIDVTQNRGEADRSPSWWPNFRVIDTAKVSSDPAMLAKVQMYSAGLNRLFDVEIATLAAALDSRTGAVRSGECAIGDLVADALRSAATADVAIINGGSIRGNRIYAGGHEIDEAGYSRRTSLRQQDHGDQDFRKGHFGRAGERVFSDRAPIGTVSASFWAWLSPSIRRRRRAARVKTVTVNGEVLDLGREYKIATNDFMASGGDGYGMLAGKTHVSPDSGTRLVALDVIDYIAAAKRIDAKIEGRIVFQ